MNVIDHDLIDRLRSGDCCNENNEDAANHIAILSDEIERLTAEIRQYRKSLEWIGANTDSPSTALACHVALESAADSNTQNLGEST